jgi:hypothetical protein
LVTISEARFRGPNGANDEFVELRNVGVDSADISGWKLQACSATSGSASNRATVPASTTLYPGGYYLIARSSYYSGSTTPDLTFSAAIADGGGVRVVDAGSAYIDGVGSVAPTTSECREGDGLTFPGANNDESFHRAGSGITDTDDNADDFDGPSASTPTNAAGETD